MHELHKIMFFFALIIVLSILLKNSTAVVNIENATGSILETLLRAVGDPGAYAKGFLNATNGTPGSPGPVTGRNGGRT